jgi:hypothetical protein
VGEDAVDDEPIGRDALVLPAALDVREADHEDAQRLAGERHRESRRVPPRVERAPSRRTDAARSRGTTSAIAIGAR